MTTKLSTWCDGLIELGCLLSLIVAPLFFNVHSDRVFEPDKLTLVRSIAVLMAVVWLVKWVDQRGWRGLAGLSGRKVAAIGRIPLVLPVLSLVLIYLLSTVLSVTPSVSWAGSYQRLQGTYTTLAYIVIFATAAHTLRRREQVRRVITTVILTSIPVALYGMLQRFGLDPLPWGGDTQSRIAGHMGNAIFIAAYLIMAVPLTAGRIVSSFANILTDEALNPADIVRSSIYIFTLAIQLIAIWWSGSRGPQLGLAVGFFAFVLIFLVSLRNAAKGEQHYSGREIALASIPAGLVIAGFLLAVFTRQTLSPLVTISMFAGSVGLAALTVFVLLGAGRGWKWLWLSWIQLAVVGAIWLVAFNFFSSAVTGPAGPRGPVAETLESWRALPGVGRLGSMLEADGGTGRVRVLIWSGALELFTADEPLIFPDGGTDGFAWLRPLIGYGPEAMYVAYNRYYPPELGTLEARNASPDRSHNETWDALLITGVLGFVAWQWLYLGVFYYGFTWLGVVRSRRDRLLLIGLWVVMGLLTAVGFSLWRGPVYIGVALPFGSIAGLVLYLIIYAVTARPGPDETGVDPFRPERLAIIALLGAIMAHYVEIHFGIAIAASRVHFFVYTALLLILGYYIPGRHEEVETQPAEPLATPTRAVGRGRRRAAPRRRGAPPAWLPPAVFGALILGVILATLAFNFTIFSPRPDQVFQTAADLPTVGDIFYDSFFVNPRTNFSESPFIFMLLIMSWLLGTLIVVSEMIKEGQILLPEKTRAGRNDRAIGLIFLAIAFFCLVPALLGLLNLVPLPPIRRVGFLTLAPLGALAAAGAGWGLIRGRERARLLAAAVAAAGIALALPIMISGGLGVGVGFLLGLFGLGLLFALWDESVASLARPALLVSLVSLVVGLAYAFLQAGRLRQTFLAPPTVTPSTPEVVRRVAEADYFVTLLSQYYTYILGALLLAAVFFVTRRAAGAGSWGTVPGALTMAILLPTAIWWINTSNLEVIQADMIYKRGKEFDSRAGSLGGAPETAEVALQFWNSAIGVYERALELTPREDFYYLWLGRAYLEKSSLLEGGEQKEILLTADRSLKRAQAINPLNTDHTANLARLNTRWASFAEGDERATRLDQAEDYYQAALSLSPQNSIIHNEYARMTYSFAQDCGRSLELYERSIAADPFFANTRFEQAEVAAVCALSAPEEERLQYFDLILEATQVGVQLSPTQEGLAQRWLRTAQTFQQLGAFDYAILAYEEAMPLADEVEPLWRIQYLTAVAYAESGDDGRAREMAQESLAGAPAEVTPQIQEFIDSLLAGS